MIMLLVRPVILLLGFSCLAIAGCSGKEPTYPVTGKVVYKDGTPAAAGVFVVFESTKEPYQRANGAIKPDGSFTLSTDRPENGAIQGPHRVCIQPISADGAGMNLTPQLSKKIDPKYFEFRTSGLKFDIKPSGKNEFVVEVERPK
jgi:hypothetical protein